MKVLDLFSGLGGWSQAFKDRGHEVLTVDIDKKFKPSICKDVMDLSLIWLDGLNPDIVLASPPCTEFSKSMMPETWKSVSKYGCNPDVTLTKRTMAIINKLHPEFWVIENVCGARKYFKPFLGEYKKKVGSRYLWGNFPDFECKPVYGKWKLPPSKDRTALRALIPYELSLAVCVACEHKEKIMIKCDNCGKECIIIHRIEGYDKTNFCGDDCSMYYARRNRIID